FLSRFALAEVPFSKRLVAGSPAITEILFQLGLGPDLVGVSEFSDYPEPAKNLPRIGSLFSPSIEKTLALRPGYVLIDAHTSQAYYLDAVSALGLKSFVFSIDSVETLFSESERFLKTVYPGERISLNEKKELLKNLPKNPAPFSFLAFTWSEPPILFGAHTF